MYHKPEVSIIPFSSINIGERYRKVYSNLESLIQSIQDNGIIQPLAVMKTKEENKYLLLAGGRRYHACKKLEIQDVPVRVYPYSENELDIRTIELAENFDRENLSFIEESLLVKKIHELQQEKFGKAYPGKGNSGGQSLTETGKILNMSGMTVQRNLTIAEAVDKIPEVLQAKDKSEALKLIAAEKERILIKELARRTEAALQKSESRVDETRKSLINSYMIIDTQDGLRQMQDNTVDIIEMDPPYAIELRKVVNATEAQKELLIGNNRQDTSGYIPMLKRYFSEAFRVLKPTGWILVWYALDPWHENIVKTLREVGFEVSGVPALWIKNNGNTRTPNIHLKNYYECFIYARKPLAMLSKIGSPNIFQYNTIAGQSKMHPNEKPIELYQEIFSTFAFPNSFILSAFAGSGNALLAASNLGHRSIGFELYEDYKDTYIAKVMQGIPGTYKSI